MAILSDYSAQIGLAELGLWMALTSGLGGGAGSFFGGWFADRMGQRDRRWYVWGSAILILAIVMQRHHFELLPDQPLDLAPSVTLRPAKGVRAVVKHRPGRPRVAEAAE